MTLNTIVFEDIKKEVFFVKTISKVIAIIALACSSAACLGCTWILCDEPKAFKDLCD